MLIPVRSLGQRWVLLLLLLLPMVGFGDVQLWIDTATARLDVIDGSHVRLSLADISIGRYGASKNKRLGDGKTPLGRFRVHSIKKDDKFGYFIVLNYPDLARADKALAAGTIDAAQYGEIKSAHGGGRLPPQNTPLGGYIGLHGIGAGDPLIHETYNWTRGCIALTNEQITRLLPWIAPGTVVEIR